jgi:hypothetical protein
MKSKRLTNDLKFNIRSRAAAAKFKREEAKLLKEETALAEEVLAVFYPPDVMMLVEALPEYLKERQGGVRAGQRLRFQTVKLLLRTEFGQHPDKAVPEPLVARIQAWKEKDNDLSSRRQKFSYALEKVLDGFTTTGKLVEMMPEAAAWIPAESGCSDIPVADKVAEFREAQKK